MQICCTGCRILLCLFDGNLLTAADGANNEEKKKEKEKISSGLISSTAMVTRVPTLSPSIELLMGKLCAIIPFYRMAVPQTCSGWRVATLSDYICILCKPAWGEEEQLCLKRKSHQTDQWASDTIKKVAVFDFHSSDVCKYTHKKRNYNFIHVNILQDWGKDSQSQCSTQDRLFLDPRLLQRDAIVLCVISSVRRRAASSWVLPRSRWCGPSF